MSSFGGVEVKTSLLRGFMRDFNYLEQIQRDAMQTVSESGNLIALSGFGSGKSVGIAMAMIQFVEESVNSTQAICICPDLETTCKIFENVKRLGEFTGITICKVENSCENVNAQIMIGMPSEINQLIRSRHVNTSTVKILAVAAAFQLLEKGNSQQRDQLILIKKKLSDSCRVFLFSTMFWKQVKDEESAEKDRKLLEFADQFVPQPVKTILHPDVHVTWNRMQQFVIKCMEQDQKFSIIKEIYETNKHGQSIIYVNNENDARKLETILKEIQFTVALILDSNSISSTELEKIYSYETRIVISTAKVLSFIADLQAFTHVINFDIPTTVTTTQQLDNRKEVTQPDYFTYLRRNTKTSTKYGRKGITINICREGEEYDFIETLKSKIQTEIQEVALEFIEDSIKRD